jgi:hypothetical protein
VRRTDTLTGMAPQAALRLQPEERRLAHSLAAMAVVVFTVVWTPWDGGARLAGFLISSAMAGSLAIVARYVGQRLWTAFAAFLLGLFGGWGSAYIVGAFFIAFAFWLGWRAHRTVKATVNADPDRVRATPLAAKKTTAIESGRVTPKKPRRSPKRS